MERFVLQEFEKRIMKSLDERFESFQRILNGFFKPLQSDTSENSTDDRSYIPDPDFKEPEEEYPTITKEKF